MTEMNRHVVAYNMVVRTCVMSGQWLLSVYEVLVAQLYGSFDPTQCACAHDMSNRLIIGVHVKRASNSPGALGKQGKECYKAEFFRKLHEYHLE